MLTVQSLHTYPIKGLRGIDLGRSAVGPRGLQHDRRWMLVDGDGNFVSQRSVPRLCLFHPTINDGSLLVTHDEDRLEVPLSPGGPPLSVTVWKDQVSAMRVSDEADVWFSARVGLPVRLVYMPDEVVRQTNPEYTRPGDRVGFADAFPVLVASQASLDDLNSRLDQPLPMNRFRANIVVSGAEPFEEDEWAEFELAGIRFRAAKKCGRCQVTTTDQDTAEVGKEPLRTLATFRKDGNLVFFGAYFVPDSNGVVKCGDHLDRYL